MFDKMKQMKKAKELQSALAQEKEEIEKQGVKVVIKGDMKIDSITLNPDLTKEEQEDLVKKCINEAMQKVQMTAAKKMSEMGGF